MVPRDGLEPSHLAAGDFESPVSTNFTTAAGKECNYAMNYVKFKGQNTNKDYAP